MTTISELKEIKDQIAILNEQKELLEARYLEEKAIKLAELDVNEYKCGVVTFDDDGHKVKIAVRKTISWDNDILKEKAKELKNEAEKFIDIKMSISETAYNKFNDKIKEYFAPARTVKQSKPTITIVEKEEE